MLILVPSPANLMNARPEVNNHQLLHHRHHLASRHSNALTPEAHDTHHMTLITTTSNDNAHTHTQLKHSEQGAQRLPPTKILNVLAFWCIPASWDKPEPIAKGPRRLLNPILT
ncbi:hypothetical protein FOCG_13874 [Fusarium oxysporum f. sp. radicis-lycopersici 26381]|uniref:Uncharacterized protein n=1 Tax=Fusarium oxysporum Fo47 TaxID=660027 RepID=W9L3U1_FUSOX|nr:hypothetical protein FOZG_01488 [Fusarium oxysporum Fo47]EWZ91136.1 hypothetical protein FOWG_06842 [Fusarium oxysporum f. sp. lycopersici MN25]EXL43426.1 hypothetical protein FOCG_13874 [Fusarium oxysporum f. sp. radicis-lycopersici 26381]KAJ4284389.1 hypothetical protein NW764_001937 [Fusarium oxysporum]